MYFLWKSGHLFQKDLKTVDGKPIEVIKPGYRNHSDGPDFLDGRIKIGEVTWSGQIEFHLKSSDWNSHKHQFDSKYNNVILHVVMQNDKKIFTEKGVELPTMVMANYTNLNQLERYRKLEKGKGWIPCEHLLEDGKDFLWTQFLSRLTMERLERKSKKILEMSEELSGDWDKIIAVLIGRYLGGTANRHAMEILIHQVPMKLVLKYAGKPKVMEALLFGLAGFLSKESKDDYHQHLQREFSHLKNLYQLKPMNQDNWKFMPVRPPAFPTLRIAQLATLLSTNPRPLNFFLKVSEPGEILQKIKVKSTAFWESHYVFGRESRKSHSAKIGSATASNIFINAVVPAVFAYGIQTGNSAYREKAMDWMEWIPPEKNSLIRNWRLRNVNPNNGMESQGLIQLKREYCEKGRCLECALGQKLINAREYSEIGENLIPLKESDLIHYIMSDC